MFGDDNLARELGIKKREVRLLSRLQTLKSESESHSKFIKLLIEELSKAFSSEASIALLYNSSKRKIEIIQTFNINPEKQKCDAIVKKLAKEAIKNEQPVMYNRILNELMIKIGIRNILSLTLKINDKKVGVVQIVNKIGKGFT